MTAVLWLISSAWAGIHADVVMSDRWLSGHRLTLSVRYKNTGKQPTTVPDLTNRPWLVVFETVDPKGIRRTVHSTAPTTDPGTTIRLQSGESRITSFEIPTSETWSPGTASVTVSIAGAPGSVHAVHLAEEGTAHHRHTAQPVDQTAGTRSTVLSFWSEGGTDLFITNKQRLQYLGRATGTIKAQASIVRTEQRQNQWFTWTDANGGLWGVQPKPHSEHAAPRRLAFPWPSSYACGPAATASSGHLVVPVCIPSPAGTVTKTVAAVIASSGAMSFRTVAAYGPRQILTNVDSTGGVEFVLIRDNAIDWAWLGIDTAVDRPTSIRKAWRGPSIESATLVLTDNDRPSPAVRIQTGESDAPVVLRSPR